MNPFQEHDQNQQEYEQALTDPVDDVQGNFIAYPLDNTGKPTQATKQIVATIGPFIDKDFYNGAGFVSRLVSQAIVRKENVPAGTVFKTGQFLLATQVSGETRVCTIQNANSMYLEWRLELWAKDEKA